MARGYLHACLEVSVALIRLHLLSGPPARTFEVRAKRLNLCPEPPRRQSQKTWSYNARVTHTLDHANCGILQPPNGSSVPRRHRLHDRAGSGDRGAGVRVRGPGAGAAPRPLLLFRSGRPAHRRPPACKALYLGGGDYGELFTQTWTRGSRALMAT